MSHWNTFMGIIHRFCEEDPAIEELLKQTDQLHKENAIYENELKDHEREHIRLQIELFNVETMMNPLNHLGTADSFEAANLKLMESCTNIRYAISQIDFVKILQCNHMKMEQNWRQEWQQIQDYSVSLLKWHEKMEQRDVVQKYRTVEMNYNEHKSNLNRHQRVMEKSLQENSLRLERAKKRMNDLILMLAEGSRDLKNIGEEYHKLQEYGEKLENMKKKKLELMEQLDKIESKNLCALLPYKSINNGNDASTSKVIQPFQKDDFPKFPSFAEILKSFNQDLNTFETKPQQITVIENTTNITVKSILHNSQDNSMEINQSITTKHTKHVRFKLQVEEQIGFNDFTDTATSDASSEDLLETPAEVEQLDQTIDENTKENQTEEEETPTVDYDCNEQFIETEGDTETEEENEVAKPKVDVLECIVIKPGWNSATDDLLTFGKENIPEKYCEDIKNKKKTDKEIMPPPPSPANTFKIQDTQSRNVFEDLLRYSPSSNNSSASESGNHGSRSILKDFNGYMNENNQNKSKEQNANPNKDSIDFMDFDRNFNFDSNDNDIEDFELS